MKIRWKKLLTAPFVFIAAIIILLEDWLWDDLARLAAAIGRLPIFRQIEKFLIGLPPYAALAMFVTPSLLLVPVKLAAFWFIAHGHPALGFMTAAGAKVAGTALVARIYALTQPNLLRIGWFALLHEKFVLFKARIYTAIKATSIYQSAHHQYLDFKAALRGFLQRRRESFLKRRWIAAMKLSRRWKQTEDQSK